VECSSCHEPHHELERQCDQCHIPAEETVHSEAAHTGCTGSGCHAETLVASFPPTRPLCLTCHGDLLDHHPEEQCTDCHALPVWGSTSEGAQR
jgi:hypothetical protein